MVFSTGLDAMAQVQTGKLLPTHPSTFQSFGHAVATSNGRILVGTAGDAFPAVAVGSASIFEFAGGAWTKSAHLIASDGAFADAFGLAVALDGDRALIGAPSSGSGPAPGSAYVFEFVGGTWLQVTRLKASNGKAGDGFGNSVALQGDRALVGAYKANGIATNTGAAYVFEKHGGTWLETAKLAASDGAAWSHFGRAVDLDGDRVVIGCPHDSTSGYEKGSAFVFTREGSSWSQTAKLIASDAGIQHFFGRAVAISGTRVLTGAIWSDAQAPKSGSAYIFEGSTGLWKETAQLLPTDGAAGFQFGNSVALEGERALVGTTAKDPDKAPAYVFERHGGSWVQSGKLVPWAVSPVGDGFPSTVALDGDQAVVGVAWDSSGSALHHGSAAAFDLANLGAPILAAPSTLSVATGGSQLIAIHPGLAHAGGWYWLLGTVSGTAPGLPLPNLGVLPLNADAYFDFTLANANLPPLVQSFGSLGALGQAVAALVIPPGTDSSLAGLVAHHAYVVIVPSSLTVSYVSTTVSAAIVP
jgi:FG-GAP repeat